MSEKQSRKLRELDKRLGVVEKFMVRVLQLVNDKHDPAGAMVGAEISEYSNDVEDFEDAEYLPIKCDKCGRTSTVLADNGDRFVCVCGGTWRFSDEA